MPTISGITFDDNDRDGKLGPGDVAKPKQVNLYLVLNGSPVLVQTQLSTASGAYAFPNLPPGLSWRAARASYPAGYKCSTDGGKGYQEFDNVTADVTTLNIGDMPIAPPTPTFKLAGLGAVALASQVAATDAMAEATIATMVKEGITSIRAFGPSIVAGGAVDASFFTQMKRLTSRGAKVVVMCGCAQGSKTLPTASDIEKYFANVAAAIGGDPGFVIEGNNEANLDDYCPVGGGDNANLPSRATFLVTMMKIARAAMPKAYIIGPSCGWNAAAQPHIDFQQALVNAGMLQYVDAINTHLYLPVAAQAEAVLAALAKMAPGKPICITECNCDVPADQYAATIAPLKASLAAHNASVWIYRWCQEPGSKLNGLDVLNADGSINTTVAQAWTGSAA